MHHNIKKRKKTWLPLKEVSFPTIYHHFTQITTNRKWHTDKTISLAIHHLNEVMLTWEKNDRIKQRFVVFFFMLTPQGQEKNNGNFPNIFNLCPLCSVILDD